MENNKTSINTYVDDVKYLDDAVKDIITVEHRLNNPKRDFLFVNRQQGKHIPASPNKMTELINILAKHTVKCKGFKESEKILVIGFCETATFIGECLAETIVKMKNSKVYYMQTTREHIESKKMFNFEEEHSHAVNEALYTLENPAIDFNEVGTVILVDDEISTGKTMLNFYNEIKATMPNANYIVASICNWQNEETAKMFKENNLESIALIVGKLKDAHIKMNVKSCADKQHDLRNSADDCDISIENTDKFSSKSVYKYSRCGHWKNDRTDLTVLCDSASVPQIVIKDNLKDIFGKHKVRNIPIDVIGTEEFMYIPYQIARMLQKSGFDVTFHATTRSPIDITEESIKENDSDIQKGIVESFKIRSPYDSSRDTFIYNLSKDRYTIVVTDASGKEFESSLDAFKNDIISAFKLAGIDGYMILKV